MPCHTGPCSPNTLRGQGRFMGRHLPKRPLQLQCTLTTQSTCWLGGTRAVPISMEKRSLGWRTAAALTALCQKSMVATWTSLQPPQIYAGGFRRDNGTNSFEEKHFGSQMTCNMGTSDQISPLANPAMLDKSALVGVQTQSPLPYLFLEPLPWKPSLTYVAGRSLTQASEGLKQDKSSSCKICQDWLKPYWPLQLEKALISEGQCDWGLQDS